MTAATVSDRVLGLIEALFARVKTAEATSEIGRERLADIENRLVALDGGPDAGQSIDRARAAVLARGGAHAATLGARKR